MEHSDKNNTDVIIFITAKCATDVTFSIYHRAKFEILPVIPPT